MMDKSGAFRGELILNRRISTYKHYYQSLAGRGLRHLGVFLLRRRDLRAHRGLQGALQRRAPVGEVAVGAGLGRLRVSRPRSHRRLEGSQGCCAPSAPEVRLRARFRGACVLRRVLVDQEGGVPPEGVLVKSGVFQ